MQVNVVISATADSKKITTTLTYVKPTAENNKLAELASALNALTTNTYQGATKEIKGEVL